MSKTVDFIFDFASPNAYLVHKIVPEIEARTGASFNYIPCLLGGIFKATGNQAPMIAFGDIKNKPEYEALEMQRFIARHNLTDFKMNPHFPVISLMLVRGALVAERDGYLMKYIDAMVDAMWEQGLKLDDPEVLHKAYADAGFDADKIMTDMSDDAIKAKLMENTNAAVARGAFGIPTFFVGDEIFFGKERLGQVEDMLT
ncbi:2-hydroxychromene-2-carboxylate isomerase [Alphaproteobacteria bacterium]|nr:2-hydroxychromene-2-carboxylate isomerase [Alphaproteobacteria bacterium]MDA8780554.1 2-hydroxychromene-2-carboxylate isomerase [Alphaproteobacteria bacterium]MDB2477397.1 2-hydroxychromene-2-carboxylate isomerase [Alphaproteobacteria bacterium]MDB2488608.1 2-hydroxychromene-2-carboxylate isomerase [Alphaproteobacteria bacterium]MDB2626031.1 2-hydroxychromene-2-carboxylate isomerase [Alphaproteobacteria bacterium]